jgi:hypothetical protein
LSERIELRNDCHIGPCQVYRFRDTQAVPKHRDEAQMRRNDLNAIQDHVGPQGREFYARLHAGRFATKDAYDRIASTNFKGHDCRATPKERKPLHDEANIGRLRMLVMRGIKPKDAVEIMFEEVALERGKNPKAMEKARADAEEFLRRIREGHI